jgi:hypothetical protein
MRCLVTGNDDQGRSCVVEVSESPEGTPNAGQAVGLWSLYRLAAEKEPRRPSGHAEFLDLGVAPDASHWMITRWHPDSEWTAFHQTDTVDFDLIVEGSIDLRLDDGEYRLVTGDCVVVTGVGHAWRAGPEGCVMSVLAMGTPPPVWSS